MKLLIVRHADPDYEIDGLTEKGKREAELLADRLCRETITALYCSPLGRARRTAEPTLARLGMTAEYCDWLREFDYAPVKLPYLDHPKGCWDILPSYLATKPGIYLPDEWKNTDFIKDSDVPSAFDRVGQELDRLLERHGYLRDGCSYRALRPNHDTVVLVCHYGVTSVLLAHLLHCSPYTLWQNCVTLPSSVTTLFTEEREQGIASLRCCGMGDLSHLFAAGEPASFSARFCECFTDDTRHH